MKQAEFHIGLEFMCGDARWRCTDVGSRLIVAIKLEQREDKSWESGPPFAIEEIAFDEYDLDGCEPCT